MDVQYLRYKKTDGVWFPSKRKYYGNGKLYQHTKYEQVRFNIELNPAIFDPDEFGTYHWFTIE
jgi:hypothetical protein